MLIVLTVFVLVSLPCISLAELAPLSDANLANLSGQEGISLDINLDDLRFQYSYQNNENTNESNWVVGKNTGPISSTVAPGAGPSINRINGIDIDVVSLVGGVAGISIGIPTSVQINRYNTGDYFVADPGSDTNSPPTDAEISQSSGDKDRKIFGLKWNTPVEFGFAAAGAAANPVKNYNFTNDVFRGSGSILIIPD